MRKPRLIYTLVVLLCAMQPSRQLMAQTASLPAITLEELVLPDMPGLQSFAFGTYDDYWVLMGGRTDGLHDHRPPFSFPESGENTFIYVVAPGTGEVWQAAIADLPDNLREQLGATNMEFCQVDTQLYLAGGYGYSTATADHITFPLFTRIHLPGLVNAVINGLPVEPHMTQITDERFAVTGGHMGYMDGTFVLAMGQRFDGRYNPHNGPSFVQEYTNALHYFTLAGGDALEIAGFSSVEDTAILHRRDYNMLPQIAADGSHYFTGFSGVFRYDADLPWLDAVHFGLDWLTHDTAFTQLLNQYHTASVAMYRAAPYAMQTVFFGGIGQYYFESGTLFMDELVPFTDNISCIQTTSTGTEELNLEKSMPGLLGASAEFIPASDAPFDEQGILLLDELPATATLIGYVVGGIESDSRNIFMLTGSSWASQRIFKVYVQANAPVGIPSSGDGSTGLLIQPNPAGNTVECTWQGDANRAIACSLFDLSGNLLDTWSFTGTYTATLPATITPGIKVLRCSDGLEERVRLLAIH